MNSEIRNVWLGLIIGGAAGFAYLPFLIPPQTTVNETLLGWYIVAGALSLVFFAGALYHYRRRVVAKHDFSDGGLGLKQPMLLWSSASYLPMAVGVFSLIFVGNLVFYVAMAVCTSVLSLFLKPSP